MIQWRVSKTSRRKTISSSSDLSHHLIKNLKDLSLAKRNGITLERSENMPLTQELCMFLILKFSSTLTPVNCKKHGLSLGKWIFFWETWHVDNPRNSWSSHAKRWFLGVIWWYFTDFNTNIYFVNMSVIYTIVPAFISAVDSKIDQTFAWGGMIQ